MRDIAEMKRIDQEMRTHDASIHLLRSENGDHEYRLRGEPLRAQVVRDTINDGWIMEKPGEIFIRCPS